MTLPAFRSEQDLFLSQFVVVIFSVFVFFQNSSNMAGGGKDFKYFYEDEVWRLNKKVPLYQYLYCTILKFVHEMGGGDG